MARKSTPSSIMYGELKRLGLSNYEVASTLMNTQLTFDGQPLKSRIDESSQLSRRIVHTEPGEIPRGLFNNFQISCPHLARMLIDRRAIRRCGGNQDKAVAELLESLTGPAAEKMLVALAKQNIDGAMLRNMNSYIAHADLPEEKDRFALALMMFVITGCLGNPRAASIVVIDYATEVLGADFQTAQTVVSAFAQPDETRIEPLLGLVRLAEGKIKAQTNIHVLNPEGTEVGLLPQAKHTIADVGPDASRRHARIWRDEGRWFVEDLGSTNGTYVISGATGEETVVAPPRALRDEDGSGASSSDGGNQPAAVELAATDILLLGATTQFMVLPVM